MHTPPDPDCLFCRIVAGEIPSAPVAEDEHFIAFHDIAPKAETHVLIVPRAHHADLDAWVSDGGSSDEMLAFAAATADQLGARGAYRLITNVGPAAGQVIFHLHWHLLAGRNLPGF